MRQLITINLPTIEEVEFEVIAEYEQMRVRGNVIVSGDDAFDKEVEDGIIERLNNGDVWSWAMVTVRASYKGITANDYLGGCSYGSEEDFKKGGYYEDMKQNAYNQLIEQLKDLAK